MFGCARLHGQQGPHAVFPADYCRQRNPSQLLIEYVEMWVKGSLGKSPFGYLVLCKSYFRSS